MSVNKDNIFKYFPFCELKDTVLDVDTVQERSVDGWGKVYFPSLSGEGCLQVWSKDRVTDYIEDFIEKFDEEPIFELNPGGVWFDKITVKNESFNDFKKERLESIGRGIKEFGTAE